MGISEPIIYHFLFHARHHFNQLPPNLHERLLDRLPSLGTRFKPLNFLFLKELFLLTFNAFSVLIALVTDSKYLDIVFAVGSDFFEPYLFNLFKRFAFMNVKY